MRIVSLLLLSVLLSSCGPLFKKVEIKGPQMADYYASRASISSSSAKIYFLRPGKVHIGQRARIHLDGQREVKLPLSACYKLEVSPGQHTLVLDLNPQYQ